MKKIKKKIGDWFGVSRGIGALQATAMPVVPAYRFARAAKRLDAELAPAVEKQNELVKKYGHTNGDGQQTRIGPEDKAWSDYIAAITPLLEEELEIELPTVTVKSLDGVNVTPAVMAAVDDLLEE